MMGQATILGIFLHAEDVGWAITILRDAGIDSRDISALFADEHELGLECARFSLDPLPESKSVLDVAIARLGGIAHLSVPGVGALCAAGPFAGELGRRDGRPQSLVSALMDEGVAYDTARRFERLVGAGGVLIAISADDQPSARRAKDVLHLCDAESVVSTLDNWSSGEQAMAQIA